MQPQPSVISLSHAIQTMEKVLSFLNSDTEPWLIFDSVFFHINVLYLSEYSEIASSVLVVPGDETSLLSIEITRHQKGEEVRVSSQGRLFSGVPHF